MNVAVEQRIKALEIQNTLSSEMLAARKAELAQREHRVKAQEARWRDAQAVVSLCCASRTP